MDDIHWWVMDEFVRWWIAGDVMDACCVVQWVDDALWIEPVKWMNGWMAGWNQSRGWVNIWFSGWMAG